MKFSTEYYSAVALMLMAVLKYFNIEVTEGEIMKNIEGVVALVAFGNLIYKRFKKGDITPLGFKK